MNTTAELPAWRIIPTPEGQFRWSPSNGNVPPLAAERLKIPIPRRTTPGSPLLLSISKLSSEATSKQREEVDGGEDGVPIFRMASRKSVAGSSLRRAETVLGGLDVSTASSTPREGVDGGEDGIPMFKTASGKSVAVSRSSLRRAETVLDGLDGSRASSMPREGVDGGENGIPMFKMASRKSVAVSRSSLRRAEIVLDGLDGSRASSTPREGIDGGEDSIPMFKTASGKPMAVSRSSLCRAETVLDGLDGSRASSTPREGVDGSEDGIPMFKTASGKSIAVSRSSLRRAETVLDGLDGSRASSMPREGVDSGEDGIPMFKTASGKPVAVSRSSLRRAETVLDGLDGSRASSTPREGVDGGEDGIPMFKTASGKSVTVSRSSLRRAETVLDGLDGSRASSTPREGIDGGEDGIPMFKTASGKPVAVSRSSLCRAETVLDGLDGSRVISMPREGVDGGEDSVSKFKTISRKSIAASQSSLHRSETVMGGLDGWRAMTEGKNGDVGFPMVHVASRSEGKDRGAMRESHLSIGVGSFCKVGGAQGASELLDLHEKDLCTSATNDLSFNEENGTSRMCFLIDGSVKERLFSDDNKENVSLNQMECVGVNVQQVTSMHTSTPLSHQIEFHTGGGRSLPISDDAIRKARILLGDGDDEILQNKHSTNILAPSVSNDRLHRMSHNKENLHFIDKNLERSGTNEPSLMLSSHKTDFALRKNVTESHFVHERARKFDDQVLQNMPRRNLSDAFEDESLRTVPEARQLRPPLVDVSNRESAFVSNQMHFSGIKRRQIRANSTPPFKRPRSTRFSTPLRSNLMDTGQSYASSIKTSRQKLPVSTCYPSCRHRKTILDFFGGPPNLHGALESLSDEVKHMNPGKAAVYKFKRLLDCEGIGADDFRDLLVQSGASSLSATKEWVQNHYKWIVWKLACLERGYPERARGKYLTPANVLKELKYRYERETDHGHRSALKRIMDGDAVASSLLVLCVSAIHPLSNNTTSEIDGESNGCDAHADKSNSSNSLMKSDAKKIELTDGWYPIDAILDAALSKHLASGKLFVGQKLRISGAALLGWVGPISSLEAGKSVSLQLFINGTYRVQWAERLGFCKGFRFPLAFRCIKGAGGQVPKTLVGIMRIYPILYKERLPDGGTVVRSERMESKILHLRNQRRQLLVEDIMSKQEKFVNESDDDTDEGAKILKILEASAEPEVLMADMSPQELTSISNYQAKQEEIKQNAVVKKIERALEEAKLGSRDVTPFMRVRVVGLNPKDSSRRRSTPLQGLITIWNPPEQLRVDLVEGQMYAVSGLTPVNSGSDLLHLHARGSKSTWKPLPASASEHFEQFFNPRHAAQLLTLGELPLSREFDIAAVVLHVGEIFSAGYLKKQWIFLTDGSFGEHHYQLLAVSLCLPTGDSDPSAFLSPMLDGSIVCFYNLIKRGRDEVNHLWLAEAMENSIWSQVASGCTVPSLYSLLKESAFRVKRWADGSPSALRNLREKILNIVNGGCAG